MTYRPQLLPKLLRASADKVGAVIAVWTIFVFIASASLLLERPAYGQATSGDIVGTVLDRSGAVIPDATVTATNEATGVSAKVQAGKTGDFHIPNLLPGKYSVIGSAAGFADFTLKGLDVTLNKTVTARLILPVAASNTVIQVSAEAGAVIDTTTTQIQSTFETEELRNLPTSSSTNGVLNLSLFVPGVATGGGHGRRNRPFGRRPPS